MLIFRSIDILCLYNLFGVLPEPHQTSACCQSHALKHRFGRGTNDRCACRMVSRVFEDLVLCYIVYLYIITLLVFCRRPRYGVW
jgi:hypothetical protein